MSHPDAVRADAPEAPTDPHAEPPTDPVAERPTDPHSSPEGTTGGPGPAALQAGDAELGDEDAREPTLDTAPERSIAVQAARTDAALGAWRHESERRSAEFAARTAEEELQATARRRRMGAAAILGASGALSTLVIGTVLALLAFPGVRRATSSAPAPASAAPAATPAVEAVPPVVTEPAASSVEADAVEPAAPVAPAPSAVRQVAPAVAPETPEAGPPVSEARVAIVGDWAWTEFSTTSPGAVTLRWRDAAHRPVLEPMGCGGPMVGGQRRCEAGRSRMRIDNALRAGATPGTWTAEACLAQSCTPLGSFPAPLP